MNRSSLPPTRQRWLLGLGALVFSVLIYGLLGYLLEHGATPRRTNPALVAQMRPYFVGAALTCLVSAVAWLRFRVDGKIGGEGREVALSPQEFQTDSIVALALSEACSIVGLALFFLGASLQEFAYFALGTFFVDFAFILPRGLQFWSEHEKRSDS